MSEVFDYGELQTVATELIAFFGRDVTLQLKNQTPADPAKPWEAPQTTSPTTITTKAAFVEFTTQDRLGSDSIKQHDKRVGVQSQEITAEWEIVDGTELWKIVDIRDTVRPGPLTVLYDLQVRV